MKQETGIRQGCPLSQYLFTIIMSVLFWDVKNNERLARNLEENRIPGTNFDEILYADDTLVISQDTRTLNYFIETLQLEGEKIGLQLNKSKT